MSVVLRSEITIAIASENFLSRMCIFASGSRLVLLQGWMKMKVYGSFADAFDWLWW